MGAREFPAGCECGGAFLLGVIVGGAGVLVIGLGIAWIIRIATKEKLF